MDGWAGEVLADLDGVRTVADLGGVLRQLRRRQARRSGTAELSCRELATRTGWAHGALGEYLGGRTLPPTDRFDELVLILGATPAERGALATARDTVAELRRSGGAPRAAPVPRELPPEAFGFAGRGSERAVLDALLDASDATGSTVVAAVVGMAGVGKTALAVSWAHRVRDRFPDGQLYLDLRGYDPDRPMTAERALAALSRSLGVAGAALPPDAAELARRYRSLLAGRRVLVVLDNASTAEQVRPLLPGTASCFTLVTSRDDLAGLVARDGARRVALEPLPTADAIGLLSSLVGPRASADAAAAEALAESCARLPLALRIAAELAAARPDSTLGGLVDELVQRRLDALDAGDDARSAIRSVFSWSLRHLPPPAAACFELLGLVPGDDVDAAAAAALVGTDTATARRLLDRLERAHLVQRGHAGRYRMHDLLRAYAAELGARRVDARAATTRLLDHYARTAAAAVDALFSYEGGVPGGPDADRAVDAGHAVDAVDALDQPAGLAWLSAERANLVAACGYAAVHGWAAQCGDLASTLWRYLDAHAHYQDALAVHSAAAEVAATTAPGGEAEAEALTNLGMVHWRLGQCEQGLGLLQRALAIRRAAGDRAGEARVLAGLGIVCEQLSRYPDSLAHYQAALAAYRELGDHRRLAVTLGNLGVLYWRLGRHPEAIDCQQRAAAAGRELGDRRLEGYALANLGLVYQQVGRYPEALRSHHVALTESRRFGDRRAEADVLSSLGVTYARTQRLAEAVEHLELALAICRQLGHRCLEAETLNNLGESLTEMHRFDAALRHHASAHAIAAEVGDRYEQARALDGTARAMDATGRCGEAARRRRQARAIQVDLGLRPANPAPPNPADPAPDLGALPRRG